MHKTISGVTIKDADKGQVSAVFSTFNVIDKDGDLTLPGAIKDGTEVVISAYGHQSHYGALPVGKGVIRTTKTEAILEGEFFMDTTHGADAFKVVKSLSESDLQEWSYSLNNVTRKSVEQDGQRYWVIEDIGLIKEVSPVLMGAGVNTRTLVAKGLKFNEEGDAVVAVVKSYLDRAGEVMALRGAKGRTLSDESKSHIEDLEELLVKARDLLTADSAPAEEDIPEETLAKAQDAFAAWLRNECAPNLAKEA
ncbi:hypothetical protein [Nocardioides stalactiti]|uniref:hypothetical protein n=1 Tax=Nocardioides stalactiti TaxID=2755356 RepID=UPI001602C3AF|nr:hypothetical protein [Nocardioides stalactiti]